MALILNIDTAIQSASICLADGETIIATASNPFGKESAAWLHTAVQTLFQENSISLSNVEAIAVSAGPGSYTGLRVGMATAKGLCYALNIPLITVSTLQMMAASAQVLASPNQLLCPMIDARRMEVFTALYSQSLQEVMKPANIILEETSFQQWLDEYSILFFGNGSEKAKPLFGHHHLNFANVETTAAHMPGLSYEKFAQCQFSELAYTEPFYGKEFYSPSFKKNI